MFFSFSVMFDSEIHETRYEKICTKHVYVTNKYRVLFAIFDLIKHEKSPCRNLDWSREENLMLI